MLLHKNYQNHTYTVTLQVDEKQNGLRLDQFLQEYLDSFSREAVKKKIRDGEITIVNRPGSHKPATLLHSNEIVIITFKKTHYEDEYWMGKKLDLILEPEIVFEDENLIVISKPPFMSTHPAGRHVFNCATVYFEMKYGHTIHSLHRIDRETSGILMLGKNSSMAVTMMKNFEDDQVKKCYLFISLIQDVYREKNSPKAFEANERLLSPDDDLRRVVVEAFSQDSDIGKEAKTRFKILHTNEKYAIGLAFPQTGRQHQIRVHAKTHGLPLIGDKLYLGSYEMFQRFKDHFATDEDYDLMHLERHALHAIGIKIPYQNSLKTFLTLIPKDFQNFIKKNIPEVDLLLLHENIRNEFHQI